MGTQVPSIDKESLTPASPPSRPRGPLATAALAIFIVAIDLVAIGVLVTGLSGKNAGSHDFISYWATGQQLVRGLNPYDEESIVRYERSMGYSASAPALIMRNPPSSLFLAIPLGFVSARTGSALWFLTILACLCLSIRLLWLLQGRPSNHLHLLGFAFAPSLFCLAAGQTGIFALLGLTLFLYFHRSKELVAGAALTLCALKPHLFLPFATVLFLWTIANRKYKVVAGFCVAWAAECGVALLFDRSAWTDYAHMMRSSVIDRELTPVISSLFRKSIDPQAMWLQFVLSAAACLWAVWYFLRNREEWNWKTHGSVLMLTSLAVAPYAWITDQAVAWPALSLAINSSRSRGLPALLSMDTVLLIAMCITISMHSFFFIWPGIFWLAWYLYATKAYDTSPELADTATAS